MEGSFKVPPVCSSVEHLSGNMRRGSCLAPLLESMLLALQTCLYCGRLRLASTRYEIRSEHDEARSFHSWRPSEAPIAYLCKGHQPAWLCAGVCQRGHQVLSKFLAAIHASRGPKDDINPRILVSGISLNQNVGSLCSCGPGRSRLFIVGSGHATLFPAGFRTASDPTLLRQSNMA